MTITSAANEKIKYLRKLIKNGACRESGFFVAEGLTLARSAPPGGIESLYIREGEEESAESIPCGKRYTVKKSLFDAVADTKSPSGVIAVVKKAAPSPIKGDVCVLLCGLSDPGNVGGIIRTACARGINSVICADAASPYSPKAVRASMGGIFYVNVVPCKVCDVADILKGYDIVSLDMGGKSIYGYKRTGKIALAIGNEAHGVPKDVLSRSAEILSIPMINSRVESLNAGVSCAIALYMID